MDEDRTVQHGMTPEQQEVFCSLVKGKEVKSRYSLESVKITNTKEVGNNLRDVYSKTVADLLEEHGLGEKAAKLALGFRYMTKGLGAKTSNLMAVGGGSGGLSEFQEDLIVFYRDWSKEVIRRFGYLEFDATCDIIVRNHTLEYITQNLETRRKSAREVVVKCLKVSV
jgi:hypothetical protein